MQLSEAGESRVNGYLFVLRRSLGSFLSRDVADDAVREVASHVRERLDEMDASGNERDAVERVLTELGPPMRVARAYSAEMTIDEALTTGRFVPTLRALWNLGTTSVLGFGWAVLVFTGWVFGISFLLIAPIKVLFPNNVGTFYVNGQLHNAGASFGMPPGTEVHPFGYWVVPVALVLGLAFIVGTQRASRRMLTWLRSHRSGPRFRVRVEVRE